MLIFSKLKPIYLLLAISILFSCSKTETPDPNEEDPNELTYIKVNSPSNITETEFTANWTVNKSTISSIRIQLSLTNDFEQVVKDVIATSITSNLTINELNGATTYFYKIIIGFADNTSITSTTQSIETPFKTEEVTFETSDGFTIAGKIAYLESNTTPQTGVIMMHEFDKSMDRWTQTLLRKKLISEGYVCLAFDFRGHGSSEAFNTDEILNDYSILSNDLIAAIDFMKSNPEVDGENLVLVGAAMGGTMAIAGNGYEEVKTTVALSPMRDGIYSIFPDLSIYSAYYIAGGQDIRYWNAEAESKYLHSITTYPKKLASVLSRFHGVDLLYQSLESDIVRWINSQMDL